MTPHDISVDWIATPEKALETEHQHSKRRGILWDELGDKLDQIPVLQDFAAHRR